jgi:transposase
VRYGVGLDVHKLNIVVCVKAQLRDAVIILIQTQTFSANPQGLKELVCFLKKFQPIAHYLMECTGVYHLPIYQALIEAFPEDQKKVVAMNPLLLHHRIDELGVKTDPINAQDLATLTFYDGMIKPSYVGTPMFHQLRDMIRMYQGIQVHLTRLKNRIHRTLDANNQKFHFDLNLEWSLTLLDHYINRTQTLQDAYNSYLQILEAEKKPTITIKKHESQICEYGNIILSDETRFTIQMDLLRYLHEDAVAASVITQVEQLILNDASMAPPYSVLLQLPGFGSATALMVLLELGDYTRFTGWKQLAKYCGVVPGIGDSATHITKRHLNRFTNKNLRYALTQVAKALMVTTKGQSDLELFARQIYITKKMPFKKATIKIGQKITRILYTIMVKGKPYDKTCDQIRKSMKRSQIGERQIKTYLEPARVRGLRREIQTFLVSNSEFLDREGRYHLTRGFHRIIKQAKKDTLNDQVDSPKHERKK